MLAFAVASRCVNDVDTQLQGALHDFDSNAGSRKVRLSIYLDAILQADFNASKADLRYEELSAS